MINGKFFVGAHEVSGRETYRAVDAATGALLDPAFHVAAIEDIEQACALAAGAFDEYRAVDLGRRARFLETIAERIESIGDELIVRAISETGLPRPRLEGEVEELRAIGCVTAGF